MDRITKSNVSVDPKAARFMDEPAVKIPEIGDKMLHLILNGPTLNSVNKYILRSMVRQLYDALKAYEDLEMTPEGIEQQLTNFSSFLMEMTGGRMSKTNYTVQAMVEQANDRLQQECDECKKRDTAPDMKPELAHLFDLIQQNPTLPIIPMVDHEIVADDTWGYWMGSWGHAAVEHCYHGEERIYFYDEKDMEDLLVEVKGWDWLDTSSEEEDLKVYRELPWIKCIVVYIDLPEQ